METIINKQSPVTDETLAESGFYWRERGGVKVLVCRDMEDAGFTNGFSTRLGGVSPFPENDLNLAGFNEDTAENIYENRRRFLAAIGGDYELATVWQVHGAHVKTVATSADVTDSNEHADALVSNLPGTLVGVKTADCVPVLVADPKHGAFAAVHAGWRGTVQSIVVKTIGAMRNRYGSEAADLVCAIGPAAGCGSYEVGPDVIGAFAGAFRDSDNYFSPTRGGHALIDLHLANRRQLTGTGVLGANIRTAPFCTMEHTNLFFSYRIEKTRFGKTGRLLSVIGRT
jgi:YfiH family protein